MTTPARRRRADSADSRSVPLQDLFDKPPPVAPEAERALLGALLQDWRMVGEVLQVVAGPQDFADAAHAAVYETVVRLFNEKGGADIVSVKQALEDGKRLAQVGGMDFLVDLHETVPSPASAPHHARIVHEKAVVRNLIGAAGLILDDCYNQGLPPAELLDRAGKRIFELQGGRSDDRAEGMLAMIARQMELLDKRANQGEGLTGLSTGFKELDDMTNGLQGGELIVVGARPSMGKTAFLMAIAQHLAVDNRVPVAVFSMEMGKDQLVQRLLCSRAGVDAGKLRKNRLSREDYGDLQRAMGELSPAPMYIDDTPGLSLMRLRARARRLVLDHGIKALFVDYLQLMQEPGFSARHEEVAFISRGIKALARELEIPVVCLAQLNRRVEDRSGGNSDNRPRMSDLKESGGIEQDADVVALLHREEYYHKSDSEKDRAWREKHEALREAGDPESLIGCAELIVDKQRNGPTGAIQLQWDPRTTSFKDRARRVG